MRKYIISILLLMPCIAFATNDTEVTGWIVVAPIATTDCQASATTMPTYGIDENSKLYSSLTYMFPDAVSSTDGIKEITKNSSDEQHISAIILLKDRREMSFPKDSIS